MKNLTFIVLMVFISGKLAAQTGSAEQFAQKIAQKMKDSLSLTDDQMKNIYSINMGLHNRKMAFRQQYTNIDSLRYYTQGVENTRDSLYKSVLSADQQILYRQKKRHLVNNN